MPSPGNTTRIRDQRGRFAGTTDLTPEQQQFVQEYLSNNGQGVEAAKVAGYLTPGSLAYHMLRNPIIEREIQRQTRNKIAAILHTALDQLGQALAAGEFRNNPKELKSLVDLLATKVLPPPTNDLPRNKFDNLDQYSVAELEKMLTEAKQQAAQAAKLIDAAAEQPAGADPSAPTQGE